MEVQVNEVDYCKLEVQYSADPDVVESKRDEVMQSLKKIKIPGFRKGKAPESAIKMKMSKEIATTVIEHMKAQAYDDVVFETEIKPIAYPQFEDVNISGNNFSCKLSLIKKPDFELKDYVYEINAPEQTIDVEEEAEGTLNNIALKLGDIQPYGDDDFVEKGDQVSISFDANIDGESFEGSSSEGMLYVVGTNAVPGFDDNLQGMSAGEERTFEVQFPEGSGEVSGKTAEFTVNVHMGTKKVACEINDEMAVKCGEENLEALKEKVNKIAKSRVEQDKQLKIRQDLIVKLVEDNDFRVPDVLAELEAQSLAMQNGIDYRQLKDEEKSIFADRAAKSVRLSLILDTIREKEPDAVLSDAEAKRGLAQRAEMNGKDPHQFLVEASKNGSILGMLSALKDEYTVQWLVDKANVIG